jgi:FkbM family methyltransferase
MEIASKTVSFHMSSKSATFLLNHLPQIRGYSILAEMFFRLLPLTSFAVMKIREMPFILDLRYRSQLTAVVRGSMDPAETSFLSQYLRQGDIFFDIGSNWGYYTALAATFVREQGLVVAIEANPKPFAKLVQMINVSGVTNVLAFNTALGDVSGDRVIIKKPWYRQDTSGFVSKSSRPNLARGIITIKTIDNLWQQLGAPRVRAAKLDVEGFEPRVLRGGEQFFSFGVTDFVLVEVNKWTQQRCGFHYSTIFDKLKLFGFIHVYTFADSLGTISSYLFDSAPLPVQCNVLFSRNPINQTKKY